MWYAEERPDGLLYVYESPTHSHRLLQQLDAQRRAGVLCDVTVLVEGQQVGAHGAVLAACSGYFMHRLQERQEVETTATTVTISLPSTVTTRGFVPLLHFAYTGKLSISRDGLQEVMHCIELLHVHDLLDSRFTQLAAELARNAEKDELLHLDLSKTDTPSQTDLQLADDLLEETADEDSAALAQIISLCSSSKNEVEDSPVGVNSDIFQTEENMTFDPLQSSKYRKYQQALIEHHGNISVSGSVTLSDPLEGISTDVTHGEPGSPALDELAPVKEGLAACVSEPKTKKDAAVQSKGEFHSSKPLDEPVQAGSVTVLQSILQHKSALTSAKAQDLLLRSQPIVGISKDESGSSRSSVIFTSGFPRQPESPGHSRSPQSVGSSNPEILPSPSPGPHTTRRQGPDKEYHGVLRTKQSAAFPDPSLDGDLERKGSVKVPQCEMSQCPFRTAFYSVLVPDVPQIKCYDSSSSSSDESSSVSTGDCESSPLKDKGREVTLPFPVDQLMYLPRSDFQLVMRMYRLTPEQLEVVQEERRRSKNRVAAQRCRKRKLDCIQSLTVDIHKLACVKETLLRERTQLRASMEDLKENIVCLSQRVHREEPEPPRTTKVPSRSSSLKTVLSPELPQHFHGNPVKVVSVLSSLGKVPSLS